VNQGLEAIDLTIEQTHRWIDELMEEADWQDRRQAFLALRAVLQAIRDRLSLDEAITFGAELPLLVRGIFFEGWRAGHERRIFTRREFLRAVSRRLTSAGQRGDPEKATRAVVRVLARNLTPLQETAA